MKVLTKLSDTYLIVEGDLFRNGQFSDNMRNFCEVEKPWKISHSTSNLLVNINQNIISDKIAKKYTLLVSIEVKKLVLNT